MSPCLATFEEGYRVTVIIDSTKESSLSGRQVTLEFE
jgi:hypothetical protein